MLAFIVGFSGLNAMHKEQFFTENICKEAFERYPFGVIFSKTAPTNLDGINFDTDFCYFYFSPGFEQRCLLRRTAMCTGTVNAKRDFRDYEQYFTDDVKVMRDYSDYKVLAFCEPWAPPGIDSFIYTRKTAMLSDGSAYMLGCFDLVDDITLSIAKFKRITHDAYAPLSPISEASIPEIWFSNAFDALPNGMAIIDLTTSSLYTNMQWDKLSLFLDIENDCIDAIDRINQLFNKYGFSTTSLDLLSNAAWLTNIKTPNGDFCDIGTYGIHSNGSNYQVVVLRPTMSSVANPYFLNGQLINR